MLHIQSKYIAQLQTNKGCSPEQDLKDLKNCLQKAIELEHATIPPYLTAMYSLIPGKNDEIADLIRSVVIEEMLHMTIAANILVAIGGSPAINTPDFIPVYPGPLPMGIAANLTVPIKAFSKQLVKSVFMEIEEPEDPIDIEKPQLKASPENHTIGTFYRNLKNKIEELGDDIFIVGKERQVLSWFDPEENIPIVDVASALEAIDVIIEEGEGTSTSPFVNDENNSNNEHEVAHYYLFEEIFEGYKIKDLGDGRYSFSGEAIPFVEDGVYPMIDNPKLEDYKDNPPLSILANNFAYGYSSLLNANSWPCIQVYFK